jgi:oligopeptide transport system ATP-binding protein
MTPLLSVKNLDVSFSTDRKKIYAVSDANFDLYSGEIVGIVGESGCGKSAMAKAITGLLPKENSKITGVVEYQGTNLLSLSQGQLQKIRGKEIATIFQDPMTSLNPTMKIGRQILEAIKKHDPILSPAEAYIRAKKLLEEVGISSPEERMEDYPHTLSGGMRQRVCIAIALSCHPKILIADEPTTAIDVTVQAQILSLLRSIQKQRQTTILLITHDLGVIANCCDKVIVMYAGNIVETALVRDLFYDTKHPYTKGLLKATPTIDSDPCKALIPILGQPPRLSEKNTSCPFTDRCGEAMVICAKTKPPVKEHKNHHTSCCWLYAERSLQ